MTVHVLSNVTSATPHKRMVLPFAYKLTIRPTSVLSSEIDKGTRCKPCCRSRDAAAQSLYAEHAYACLSRVLP